MSRRSLRTRLTLLYTGLAVIVLAISLLTVYVVTRREALNRLDNSLHADAIALKSHAERAERGNEGASAERFVNARDAVISGHLLALLDSGQVLASAPTARALIDEARRQGKLTGGDQTLSIALGGQQFRMVVMRADTGEYAIAAGSLETVTEAEESLLNATLLAGAVGIVVTAVGAWFATRRGLRPLESITAMANDVASDAMELRTGLADQDEIGAVAAAIDRMLSRLQHAFDSQKRFLEDVSHELRTPLTIARGHLELVAEDPDATAQERAEAVTVAIDEIDRVARLVDGLLELARASEVERLDIGPVAVGPLLEAVAAQMSRLQEREWRVDVPEGTEAAADEAALRQIILNLARNADEHSPRRAEIELAATAQDGHVQIMVADRGTGVDPDIAGRAFERFTHDGNGVGLGLSISQALAEAQHGRVSLEPRAGGGTVAIVELPRPQQLIHKSREAYGERGS